MSLEMAIWLFVIGVPGLIMLLTGRPLITPSLLRLINPGRHRLLARCCGALLLCACGCMIISAANAEWLQLIGRVGVVVSSVAALLVIVLFHLKD